MPSISSRASAIQPSRTIAFNQRARELKAAGQDIIDLTVGEPDFRPPAAVLEAAAAAVLKGADRYTPVAGLPELRRAAADMYRQYKGLDYAPEQLVVSCGAKNGIANAMLALVNPGDEVIVPLPAWPTYTEMARLAGGTPVTTPSDAATGYKLDPERLRAALGPKSRLLVVGTPSNPTGAVYTLAELEALARVLEAFPDVWILSDEVYSRIRYVPEVPSPAAIPSLKDRCVIIDGLSKSHAMTGWRIGFSAAPASVTAACVAIQGQTVTCAPGISQLAGLAALTGDQSPVDAMVAAYTKRRSDFITSLRSVPGFIVPQPDGAFYAWPDVTGLFGLSWKGRPLENVDDVALFLLEEALVALVPGSAFGDPASLRFSFAASDALLASAANRIHEAAASLHDR
jgi:aspartate aminotransferase